MSLIVSALHQPLASSICSSMDTNTSIMYEGSDMSLYSMWAYIAAKLGQIKAAVGAQFLLKSLSPIAGLHQSVIYWILFQGSDSVWQVRMYISLQSFVLNLAVFVLAV